MSFRKISIWKWKELLSDSNLPLTLFSEDGHMREMALEAFFSVCKIKRESADFYLGGELTETIISMHTGEGLLFESLDERFLVIIEAQLISDHLFELMANLPSLKNIIFSFAKKPLLKSSFYNIKNIDSVEILSPRFWEYEEYLEFLLKEFHLRLTGDAKKYFMRSVKQVPYDYYNALNNMRIGLEDSKQLSPSTLLTLEERDLHQFLGGNFFDSFYALDLFIQRRFKSFFSFLVSLEDVTFEEWRLFAVFMQNQLVKLKSLEILTVSKKLSSFEKKMALSAKFWNEEEVGRSINFFSEIEKDAKTQNSRLRVKLRTKIL